MAGRIYGSVYHHTSQYDGAKEKEEKTQEQTKSHEDKDTQEEERTNDQGEDKITDVVGN